MIKGYSMKPPRAANLVLAPLGRMRLFLEFCRYHHNILVGVHHQELAYG